MVETYSDYIRDFITAYSGKKSSPPGEHHFVALYLLPRFQDAAFFAFAKEAEYINPDGTKKVEWQNETYCVPGDLVFLVQGKFLGIEVKLSFAKTPKFRPTKEQYHKWIRDSKAPKPKVLVFVCPKGILLFLWSDFAEVYKATIYPKGLPDRLEKVAEQKDEEKYALPIGWEDLLKSGRGKKFTFEANDITEKKRLEIHFIAVLRQMLLE